MSRLTTKQQEEYLEYLKNNISENIDTYAGFLLENQDVLDRVNEFFEKQDLQALENKLIDTLKKSNLRIENYEFLGKELIDHIKKTLNKPESITLNNLYVLDRIDLRNSHFMFNLNNEEYFLYELRGEDLYQFKSSALNTRNELFSKHYCIEKAIEDALRYTEIIYIIRK